MLESYENLEVIDDCLHMNVMAYNTKRRTTMVIPDRMAPKALSMLHEGCEHTPPWQMIEEIMDRYYFHNIKKLNNSFECKICNLRPRATYQEQLSTTNLGETVECDLVQMVPTTHEGITYKYMMVITESTSKFVITEKLKSNSDTQILASIVRGLDNSSLVPRFYSLKSSLTTKSELIAEKLASKNMQPLVERKTSESNISTTLLTTNSTLLKNSLNKTDSWPKSLPSATLALNATLRRYHLGPGGITSSSHIFNGREPAVTLNNDAQFNIANTVMMNNETALNDTLSYVNTETNSTFEIGQLIMIRKEFISGAVG